MSRATPVLPRARLPSELPKLFAFLRRDVLIAWSYRLVFVTDVGGLAAQALVFAFVAQLIDPRAMPEIGGVRPSYLSFVVVGLAVGAFVQLGLGRVMAALRTEQLLGTLEVMFLTPTRSPTVQVGLVAYDLVYIPVRTGLFLAIVSAVLDAELVMHDFHVAALLLVAFIPFVWGLGAASAAGVLAFRRGSGMVGVGAGLLTLTGGVYFPVEVFPRWLQVLAEYNPLTSTLRAIREVLLTGAGFGDVMPTLLVMLPVSLVTLAVGTGMFELALRRERRRGTLGVH